MDEASALLDELYDGMGRVDGIYVVNLSGAGTYAAGYGDAAGADRGRPDRGRPGRHDHTLGQVDQILDGTLDELGAPDDGGVSAGLGGRRRCSSVPRRPRAVTLGWLRWRRRPRRRPSGETWAGPADYRPSFPTYGDQQDTVEDRAALAREDVTRLGEELDAADPPLTDPAVAAHVQAALDAYADASRRVDSLTRDDELRQLAAGHRVRPLAARLRRGAARRDPTAAARGCPASSTPRTASRSRTCRGRRPGARSDRSRSAGPATTG